MGKSGQNIAESTDPHLFVQILGLAGADAGLLHAVRSSELGLHVDGPAAAECAGVVWLGFFLVEAHDLAAVLAARHVERFGRLFDGCHAQTAVVVERGVDIALKLLAQRLAHRADQLAAGVFAVIFH